MNKKLFIIFLSYSYVNYNFSTNKSLQDHQYIDIQLNKENFDDDTKKL